LLDENYDLLLLSVDSRKIAYEEFKAKTEAIRSCRDARKLAKSIGGVVQRDRFVPSWDLSMEVREYLSEIPTGRSTQVFGADPSVMRVQVICGRNVE